MKRAPAVLKFTASVVATFALVFAPTRPAMAAECVSRVGPGIPPPASVAAGVSGFHASWYGQSGYMSLCPGTRSTATVAYYIT